MFGNALWSEYQDLLGRPVWGEGTSANERQQVLAALARQDRWVTAYYGWRPNLPDEADNHLIELALAGGAQAIVTHNLRDMRGEELRLGKLRVMTPAQCLRNRNEHLNHSAAWRHGVTSQVPCSELRAGYEQTGRATQRPRPLGLGHRKPLSRHGGNGRCATGTGGTEPARSGQWKRHYDLKKRGKDFYFGPLSMRPTQPSRTTQW